MVRMNNQYKWMVYVGLEVLTLNGWSTRGSSSFHPTNTLCHWIAGPRGVAAGRRPSLALIRDGHGSLPGPLASNYGGRAGEVVLVAAGRANHAGYGYWKGVTGNTGLMGTEMEAADGSDWTAEQRKSYPLIKIAELFAMWEKGLISWSQITSNRVAGHSEFALPAGRKVDINGYTMNQLRAQIAALIPGFKKRVAQKPISVGTPAVFDRDTWKFLDGSKPSNPVNTSPGNSTSYRVKRTNTDSVEVKAGSYRTSDTIDTLHNAGYNVNVVQTKGSWTQIRNSNGNNGNGWVPTASLNPFFEDERASSGTATVDFISRTTEPNVEVWAGTGSNADQIGTMHGQGYRVFVTGMKGDTGSWSRIKWDGSTGWVETKHLEQA